MLDDQKYISALRDKETILCQEIYDKFLPKVVRMIIAKGGNELQAKDVFQQAILAILLDLKTRNILLKASFEAYLKRICYFKFIDLCRKQKIKLRNEEPLRLISEEDENADNTMQKEDRLNLIEQCFQRLSEDCKTIINGKLKGIKAKNIMEKINFTKSANAFYQKRFDCMRRLRELIEQHPEYATIKI